MLLRRGHGAQQQGRSHLHRRGWSGVCSPAEMRAGLTYYICYIKTHCRPHIPHELHIHRPHTPHTSDGERVPSGQTITRQRDHSGITAGATRGAASGETAGTGQDYTSRLSSHKLPIHLQITRSTCRSRMALSRSSTRAAKIVGVTGTCNTGHEKTWLGVGVCRVAAGHVKTCTHHMALLTKRTIMVTHVDGHGGSWGRVWCMWRAPRLHHGSQGRVWNSVAPLGMHNERSTPLHMHNEGKPQTAAGTKLQALEMLGWVLTLASIS